MDLNYKYWKKVRDIIDSDNQIRAKKELKKYCLSNPILFPISNATFSNYMGLERFNVPQQIYIWEYLKEFYPDKVEIILNKVVRN
jgi:hypothetical protein